MRQNKRCGIIMAAALVLLAGCGRQQDPTSATEVVAVKESIRVGETTEEGETVTKTDNTAAKKKHLVQAGDGVLKVDADIQIPERGLENIEKLTAKCKQWDEKEKLEKILIPNSDSSEWRQAEDGNWLYHDETEGATIGANLYYVTAEYESKDYFGPSIVENFPDTYYDDEKDLTFLSIKEATEQAKEFLKRLGIDNVVMKKIYPVDEEKLNGRTKERMSEEGNELFLEKAGLTTPPQWTEEDEYYLLEAVTEIDGIEIKEFGYLRQDFAYISGSGIEIAIGKDGVEYLQASAVYEKQAGEPVSIREPEQILEKVREKIDLLILNSEVLIKDMNLVYYPVLQDIETETVTLLPVWEVRAEIEGNTLNYYFDGETGKELIQ